MKDYIIKFSNVTQAMKAKKILNSHGIKSTLERMTSTQGCGYQIKTNINSNKIDQILTRYNISFIR